MSNVIFPAITTQAWPIRRSPQWATRIQSSSSGKETRIGYWSYPYWDYVISFDLLRSLGAFTELQQIAGFYNARNGSFDDWLFNDPSDNSCTLEQFGVGNGVTTTFQLARAYGGYVEPVRAVNTLTQVMVNNVLDPLHTINQFAGTITFNTPPPNGHPLTWSGTFWWRCRFLEDQIDFNTTMNGMSDLKSLKFRTLK